ncbi:MAG: alpha/beta hydrolase [Actinomycetia bacterium]|nr:alpha/beta hydrolase [Actinomycetes bacterium]MDQ1653596.1 uncharacterized protein [Cryptosporangiaceae bacterium]MDQ1659497.1 uncharacterized protein [Cryptosporangiaceae bacterium]
MPATLLNFRSGGLLLTGDLRVPDGPPPGAGFPAIVFTGPLSGVKEQVTGLYAQRLAEHGYITLAFDHRNFGASEGEPRQHEDPAGKFADLRDAVSVLAAHPDVDGERIAVVGICLGGGYALRFSAFDPRVRAVACVAGGFNDPRAMRDSMGADQYRGLLARFAQVAAHDHATGVTSYTLAVSGDETPAVMGGAEPFDYYGSERSASPGWVNQLTELTVRELITTDLAIGADFVSPTPLLIVHGRTDAYCSPEGAQDVYERAGEPKELLWLDTTNHIDLYDQPQYVEPAIERITDWFAKFV